MIKILVTTQHFYRLVLKYSSLLLSDYDGFIASSPRSNAIQIEGADEQCII